MKIPVVRLLDRCGLLPFFEPCTRNRATVFMMHRLGRQPKEGITPGQLADFFSYLKARRYSVIGLREYVERLRKGANFRKTVVFTVDDGYADFHEFAFPVFRRYGMPAAVFLATGFIDRGEINWWDAAKHLWGQQASRKRLEKIIHEFWPDETFTRSADLIERIKDLPADGSVVFRRKMEALLTPRDCRYLRRNHAPLSWAKIRQMKDGGIEFYPHTASHPILSRLPEDEIRTELSSSRRRIERQLGSRAEIFCYPNGRMCDFDERTVRLLKETGFVASFTAEEGFDPSHRQPDLFRLKRYPLPADFTRFKLLVSGMECLKADLRRTVNA